MERIFRLYEKMMCLHHEKETGHETWHWSRIPDDVLVKSGWRYNLNRLRATRVRNKLQGLPMEYGLDGISYDKTTYHGLQAKCWQNSIRASDLGTFLSVMMNRLCVKNKSSQGFLYTMAQLEHQLKDDLTNGGVVHTRRLSYPTQEQVEETSVQDEVFAPKPLRDYQINAVVCLAECKDTGIDNGWLNMCCGTGKTLIYSEFARSFKKIIVISPLRVSAEQNLRRIAEWLGLDKDNTLLVDCDGVRDSVAVRKFWKKRGQLLVSSTFKSADDVLQPALFDEKKLLGKDVLIVVDEAHNRSEEMREWLSEKKGDAFLLWVSATPIPHEDEPVLFKYSWSDALANNWICDYEIFLPILEKKEEEEDEDEEKMSIGKRELLTLKAQYLVIGMMRTGASRVIVYCHSKSECDEFATLFRQQCQDKMGLLEDDVWMSKITDEVPSKQRARILEEFQKNEARLSVLTSVRILDEAIDIPKCDGIFLMRVSKNKESWVRTVQRMSRANRLDPDNPHKKSNIFLWLNKREQENMPKCLEMIRTNDPEFFKKIRCISMDSYDRDDSMEELVAVEQNETTQAQSIYSVKCVSMEELKELKLSMIIEYYKRHGRWVKNKHVQDGYKLGMFWLCIKNGHTHINEEQRRRCLELDPECFKMRIFNKVALAMSMDEKIAECIQYWEASGRTEWPPSKLKTLWNIGTFWHCVKNGSVKLTEEKKTTAIGA